MTERKKREQTGEILGKINLPCGENAKMTLIFLLGSLVYDNISEELGTQRG